mgnify:CR=1 FL=1
MRSINFKSALISFLIAFSIAFFITTFSSCKKANDTIGIIIVKDSNGNTVSGATVVLHQDGLISPQGNSTNSELRKTSLTDSNGRAEFTYQLEVWNTVLMNWNLVNTIVVADTFYTFTNLFDWK